MFSLLKRILLPALFILNALATPEPIPSKNVIDLAAKTGKSFLQTMIEPVSGIVATFDKDYESSYEFGSDLEAITAVENFDKKNYNRIMRVFNYDKKLLGRFALKLKELEKTFTPSSVSSKVGKVLRLMKLDGDQFALGQFFAIASGAGTLIKIDENNYYYNIGYYHPEVRSGRSYGATTLHNANDASHLMYLRQLEEYLESKTDHNLFFKGIMKFLVDTDVNVYQDVNFNDEGEAVLTDYITVYTAELRRQIMRNLNPGSAPWGNDMTEATFLSIYNVSSGLMMLDEGLVKSSIKEHWALSKSGSGRSGFGINRSPRRKLQSKISAFYRFNKDPSKRELVHAIDKLIGKSKNGDVYRGVMEFLNNRKNLTSQSIVDNVETELTEAFVKFVMATREDAESITRYLRKEE